MKNQHPYFETVESFTAYVAQPPYNDPGIRFKMDADGELYLMKIGPFWHSIVKELGRADIYQDNHYRDFNDAAQDMLRELDASLRKPRRRIDPYGRY